MKLYAISGLGADKRAFEKLRLDCELVHIDWVQPNKEEPIEDYAQRLSKAINQEEPFSVLGLSFGGLIATEISKRLDPILTVLVSTVEVRAELPRINRLIGNSGIIKYLPNQVFKPPKFLADWAFGAKDKQLLHAILEDTDLEFAQWALQALMTWKNTEKLKNKVLRISGTRDKLMPFSKDENTKWIEGGTHFMIVDCAEEISGLIRLYSERIYELKK